MWMPELAIPHNIHKPHWHHGKKIAYSRNAKIAIAENLKIFSLPITFLLPVSYYPYLVILERVDLSYIQSKFGKNLPRKLKL